MIRTVLAALAVGAFAMAGPASAEDKPAQGALPLARQASPAGCTTPQSTEAQRRAAGDALFQDMLSLQPGLPPMPAQTTPFTFAPGLGAISQVNIFQNIWTRCGLSRRDRELVTLGVLVALRADSELRYHFPIALRNGLSRTELEEVLIQASGYAGIPAAMSARAVAEESLGKK
ncbi:MAG TPA: carboxymuconolactone decarboxylase family protein [Novosphingobium sp.]|nr:carboxymuconolactone decarboxylase family protein [Novosphingobium sp.]